MNSRVLWGSAILTPIGTYKTAIFMDSLVCREAEHRKRYQMKIYCKGISEENIDFIVERRLKAFITTDHAIVTVTDDSRNILELRQYLEVRESLTEYILIWFSPEMIIPDMKYILINQDGVNQQELLISEFEDSFFDMVIKLAEASENLTRAEATRLIWIKFMNGDTDAYNPIDENELQAYMSRVDKSADEAWSNIKFVEIVIKYSTYLISWEKRYGYESTKKYLNYKLGVRRVKAHESKSMQKQNVIENEFIDGITFPNETARSWFAHLIVGDNADISASIRNAKIPAEIVSAFQKNKIIESIGKIEREVYHGCNIFIDESADTYRKFFFDTHYSSEKIKACFFELLLWVNSFYYCYMNTTKKNTFLFCMDDSNHIGDISDVINNITVSATEIVLMQTAKINQDLLKDKKWTDMRLVDFADEIQVVILPAVISLLKSEGYSERDENIDTKVLFETFYKSSDIRGQARKISEERVSYLKDKDSGMVMGSFVFFGSENDCINDFLNEEQKQYKGKKSKNNYYVYPIRNRAKRSEKNYWIQRRKSFVKKYEIINMSIFDNIDVNIAGIFLEYIHLQNRALRSAVRKHIASCIQEL